MSKFPQVKDQMDLILRGTEEVIPIEELEKKIEVAKRFKVSNKELDYLSFLSQFTATFSAENCDLKSGVNLFASPLFDKALQVYLAPMGAGEKDLTLAKIVNLKLRLLPHVERRLANKKIVTAADLMQLGVKPGQMMGKLITAAEELAIEKNILDKEQILPFLRQLI